MFRSSKESFVMLVSTKRHWRKLFANLKSRTWSKEKLWTRSPTARNISSRSRHSWKTSGCGKTKIKRSRLHLKETKRQDRCRLKRLKTSKRRIKSIRVNFSSWRLSNRNRALQDSKMRHLHQHYQVFRLRNKSRSSENSWKKNTLSNELKWKKLKTKQSP